MNQRLERVLIVVLLMLCNVVSYSQLVGTGCVGMTSYTNGAANDSIYYYPAGTPGSLTATPPSGVPGWNFVWTSYTVGSSSWTVFTTENNVASSTIGNLNPGAYAVAIYDGNNTMVGCYRAWILQITEEPSVDVAPIAPNCTGPVMLNGTIDGGGVSPYSNLPATQMIIDANTEMSICYSGTHTWVSDLAFYVIGPPSCGSPNLLLLPNPGAIGQGAVCNSGNNITNLCFSTESSNNINVCAPAPATLSGTYGTYGPGNTPINWSTLYGCDASNGGWSVQIYDCIGGDVGSLTDATLTFSGVDGCGADQTVTYSTPSGYNSGISDLSCSSSSASIFTVTPAIAPPAIVCEFGYEWSSEPYVYIADSTTSLNIQLDQLIDASGNVIPWQTVAFTLSITNTCDSLGGENGCFGGNSEDTEIFVYTPTQTISLAPVGPVCVFDQPFALTTNITGGTWSGAGITDPIAGIFDPAVAGVGFFDISYGVNDPCTMPATMTIEVADQPVVDFSPPAGFCIDASPQNLSDYLVGSNVTFSGPGIVDGNQGIFDPAVAGTGVHQITANVPGICDVTVTVNIEVYDLPVVNAGVDAEVCANATHQLQAGGALTYSWSPSTFLNDNSISNPISDPDSDITYLVTGTDIHGCQNDDVVSLVLLPEPELTVNSVEMVCPGTQVTLEASGSIGNYSWSPSAGMTGANAQIATVSPQVTTNYTVTLTDDCNIQVQAVVNVPVEVIYTVDAGANQVFCAGDSILIVASVNGPDPEIQWSTVDGFLYGDSQSNQLLVNNAGAYSIEVTTPLGCVYSDQVLVGETPLPYLNLLDSAHYCPFETVILHAGNNWDQVLWSTGETTPDIVVGNNGIYNVLVTDNGCSSEGGIVVYQVILPYVELGPDVSICQGDVAALDAGVVGEWSTGDNDDVINVSAAGTYEVVVEVLNCSTMDSIHVIVMPLPIANLDPTAIGCQDQPLALYADHPYNDTYLWNTGEFTPSIEVFTPGDYWVMASNECGEAVDYIDVSFEDCSSSIFIPNSFTPDNDGINDVWQVSTFNVKNLEIIIYNRWGEILFLSNEPQATWTGEVKGGDYYAPDGIYHYRIKYETDKTNVVERIGMVTIIR